MVSVYLAHLHYKVGTTTNGNIFYEHLLPLQHAQPIIKYTSQQAWASVVLILAFSITVILKVNAYPKLIKIIQSTYNTQVNAQLEREEFNPFRSYSILLNALYLITFAFLVYKINAYYQLVYLNNSSFVQFLLFVILVLLFYVFKFAINKALSIITDETKSIYEFETNCYIINYATGLFLLPWLVLSELSRFNSIVFISGAVVVLALSVFLKWYRGLVTGLLKQRVGLLQILTYFCVLEILPTLVLVKYLIETF